MTDQPVRIYSVVTSSFRYGFLVLAKTLIAENPQLTFEFRILYNPELGPLEEPHREFLRRHVPDLEFVCVDLGSYGDVFHLRDQVFQTPKRLWAAFLILEVFRDEHPGKVLCLDSDMICVGALDQGLLDPGEFAAVEAHDDRGRGRGFFNTGVLSLPRSCRGEEQYREIMRMRDTSGYNPKAGKADQALLSLIYTPKNAKSLPLRYNLTKRQAPSQDLERYLRDGDAVFFHYVGAKPWHVSVDPRDADDAEAVALWDGLIRDLLSDDEFLQYLIDFRDVSRQVGHEQARAYWDQYLELKGLRKKVALLDPETTDSRRPTRLVAEFPEPAQRIMKKALARLPSGISSRLTKFFPH